MAGDEQGRPHDGRSCDAVEGGYTIILDEKRVTSFFEAGDLSSASELDHFSEIGSQVEKRIREGGGHALLALSIGEKTLSRDFAMLQIAHFLAKHGRNVLIVDCDFLHPGMSGLVDNIEEHGFLDLLLYGSSLRTVARSIGIDGVSVIGPGSFPVARTIPFALKEFGKIGDFLKAKHDVVIYSSTLYTEDGKINPLSTLVDSLLLCCRIEEMDEGELQKSLKDLGAGHVPPVELICFCGTKERPAVAAAAPKPAERRPPEVREMPTVEPPGKVEEPLGVPALEKIEELEPLVEPAGPRINFARLAAVSVIALVAVFVVWWIVVNRAGREGGPRQTTTGVVPERQGALSGEQTAAPETAGAAPGAIADTAGGGAGITPETQETARPGEPGPSTVAPRTGGQVGTAGAGASEAIPAEAKYTIHVASFTESYRAELEKKYLDDNGFQARIVEVDIRGVKWLRVLVGAYTTMDEANEARLSLLSLRRIGYARVIAISEAGK